MTDSAIHTTVKSSEKGILRALLYFDIFDYPLTENEIANFSPFQLNGDLKASLDALVDKKIVYQFEQYYTLHDKGHLVQRRTSGNRLAEKQLKIARRISKFISMFPFVRAVWLSGSISKDFMDEQSDIDYFIITEPRRLWIVRTAMAFFRRVFFMNSRKYFCTNYFIDSENLEISEKNIFTAVEVTTLKPMFGKKYFHDFQTVNKWCDEYLPNRMPQNGLKDESALPFKKTAEKLLSFPIYDRVDRWLMNRGLARWKKKYDHLLTAWDFSIAFQSTPSVSRSHPGFYQKKVLSQYDLKIRKFEQVHSLSLAV